jgi:hypothetical protein
MTNFQRRFTWFLIIGFIILSILLVFFMPNIITSIDMRLAIYSHKWVAVYVNNNQTFYGRIASFNSKVLKLTDVYYLSSVAVAEQQNAALVKRGQNEISSPENALFINRSQILYFENMKPDAQIMKIIFENEAKK